MNSSNNLEKSLDDYSDERDFSSGHFLLNLVSTLFVLIFIILFNQNRVRDNIENIKVESNVLSTIVQIENVGLPVRLVIPALNIDARIEEVGITTLGMMGIPEQVTNVGWFKFGYRPGEVGSAVIAGHFNDSFGEGAVFENLYKLKKGDILYVEDDNGVFTVFTVQKSAVYDAGFADEIFNRNDGTYLNLITCDGVWDGIKKSFSKRLVVFSDMAN